MTGIGTLIMGDSLREVWRQYVRYVVNGTAGEDDGQPLHERFGVQISFSPQADFHTPHPAMDLARQQQYVHKILSTEIDPELGGGYGYRIFLKPYGNQFEAAVNKLLERPASKSVLINLLHPLEWEQTATPTIKRMACLTHIQFLIRAEKLYLLAHFRSQDAWHSHGNFKGLRALQQQMIDRLQASGTSVGAGNLSITVAAAHVYQRNLAQAMAL